MRRPSGPYTRLAGATRCSPGTCSGIVPPTMVRPCSRALAASICWIGPSPSASATARRCSERCAISAEFSDGTARRAPRAAASPSSSRARARFAATSTPEVICTAATLKGPEVTAWSPLAICTSRQHHVEMIERIQGLGLQPDGPPQLGLQFAQHRDLLGLQPVHHVLVRQHHQLIALELAALARELAEHLVAHGLGGAHITASLALR